MTQPQQAWMTDAQIELAFLIEPCKPAQQGQAANCDYRFDHQTAGGRLTSKGRKKIEAYRDSMHTMTSIDPKGRRVSTIDPNSARVVYATSDIHADFPELVCLMESLHLIKTPLKPRNWKTDYVYLWSVVTDTTWLPFKVLFIIVGDLVDGRRSFGSQIPPHRPLVFGTTDPEGSFELLIHAFLYNMRIRAAQRKSNVVFTLGNHDVTSVFEIDETRLDPYIHDTAKQYWGRLWQLQHPAIKPPRAAQPREMRFIRRYTLGPFYECSPFLTFHLGSDVSFVHGAFHTAMRPVQVTRHTNYAETRWDEIPGWSRATEELASSNNMTRILDPGLTGGRIVDAVQEVVNSRAYSDRDDSGLHPRDQRSECPPKSLGVGKLIVVGHCPTQQIRSVDFIAKERSCNSPEVVPRPLPVPLPVRHNQERAANLRRAAHGCVVLRHEGHKAVDGRAHTGTTRQYEYETGLDGSVQAVVEDCEQYVAFVDGALSECMTQSLIQVHNESRLLNRTGDTPVPLDTRSRYHVLKLINVSYAKTVFDRHVAKNLAMLEPGEPFNGAKDPAYARNVKRRKREWGKMLPMTSDPRDVATQIQPIKAGLLRTQTFAICRVEVGMDRPVAYVCGHGYTIATAPERHYDVCDERLLYWRDV